LAFDGKINIGNGESWRLNFKLVSWFQKRGIEKFQGLRHNATKVFDVGRIKYFNGWIVISFLMDQM
jgi:hypothetical protein